MAMVLLYIITVPMEKVVIMDCTPPPDEVMKFHFFVYPTEIHVLPELVEVQMPSKATAASFVPSSEEVMAFQYFTDPIEVTSVHKLPESVDVHNNFPSLKKSNHSLLRRYCSPTDT